MPIIPTYFTANCFKTCHFSYDILDVIEGTLSDIHRYAYSRLKWLGNKLLSFAVTMFFVSLWHGLWPGYFLCFFHELVCVQAEREVSYRLVVVVAGARCL